MADVPTCREYAAMAPDTGPGATTSGEQRDAITAMLTKRGKGVSVANVTLAEMQVIAYCTIDGGTAGGNEDQPIDGIPGMRD